MGEPPLPRRLRYALEHTLAEVPRQRWEIEALGRFSKLHALYGPCPSGLPRGIEFAGVRLSPIAGDGSITRQGARDRRAVSPRCPGHLPSSRRRAGWVAATIATTAASTPALSAPAKGGEVMAATPPSSPPSGIRLKQML